MNKLTAFLLSSIVLLGAAGCSEVAKTSPNAPDSVAEAPKQLNLDAALRNETDATDPMRRAQANSDIRVREQRYNLFRDGQARSDDNIKSEVRSKLEVNLQTAQLAVDSQNGVVTVAGAVQNEYHLSKIEPLAREIRGVKDVVVKAIVSPALPVDANNDRS